MTFGKININNHSNSPPVYYIDVGSGCYFCLNRHRAKNGRFMAKHKTKGCINLARIIYENKFGELPNNIDIHHKCENKWCINIKHLEPIDKKIHRQYHAKKRHTKVLPKAKKSILVALSESCLRTLDNKGFVI